MNIIRKIFQKKEKSVGFFDSISDGALERLLSDQDPGDLSLLAVNLSADEMARIFEVLPVHTSSCVSVSRSRHHRQPQGILKEQADRYLEKTIIRMNEFKAAKLKARERIQSALSSIDFGFENEMNEKIEKEMPELKKILDQQGYFETSRKIYKGVN